MAEVAKLVNNADASNPTPPTATFAKSLPNISKIEVFTGRNAFIFCWTCMELSSLFLLPNLISVMMPVNFNNGFKPIRYVVTLC